MEYRSRDISQYSDKELLALSEKLKLETADENNFQNALFFDNRHYCDEIKHGSKRRSCYNLVKDYKELPESETYTQASDENFFQSALFEKNKSLCNDIVDSEKKDLCFTLLS